MGGNGDTTVTTHGILVRTARMNLDSQRADGSFPPGRNYTYDEQSTPVRTTSQWLQTLVKTFEITGDKVFEEAANRAVDYLVSDDCRPNRFTYDCRDVEGKDRCNGLVGQASAIRALADAASILDRSDASETAEEVFKLHPFHKRLALWESVEIDGQKLSFDRTLNHQLLFAEAATHLVDDSSLVRDRVRAFLSTLGDNMHTHENGLIRHYVRPPFSTVLAEVFRTPRHRVMLRNEVVYHYYSRSSGHRMKKRGYQTVNLIALARIHTVFPNHSFWESRIFQDSYDFMRSHECELINRNQLKHGSLLQGVRIARIRNEFNDIDDSTLISLLAEDLDDNPVNNEGPFKDLGIDESDAASLVSELVDFPNVAVPLSDES